ncbi:hypothetical protein RA086_08820 [Lactiplantibacillus sp. WILCCON 0030]|uniref:Transporter n=1 Tax=Lactiplantibacillus brownii TaxID=3069269 RepID=A0ABU1AAP6_9LACO|nr:hypothetical protein [Lactiplantibacillus brownii]MDQ7937710.1 hypothetical protein [Lactiplantibacillus brownii]
MNKGLNRTKAASLNATTMFVTQIVGLVLKFLVQTAFIHELSQNYLGLNGLFANVISFLSFADLGIGTAITVALYQPIAENNMPKLRVLVDFYRKTYLVIIGVTTVVGVLMSPWIYTFIKNPVFSQTQLAMWFLLYLASTIMTYFSAHKRSFLISTQEEYLNSLNDFSFKAIQQISQVVVIMVWQSFAGFLVIQLVATLMANWQLSRMVQKRYPAIFRREAQKEKYVMDRQAIRQIKKNVVGAISSKIGTIVVFGTDNLILSMFIGLTAVAKYSNYMLVIQSMNSLFSQVIGSFVSSIGNLHATATPERQEKVLYRLMYINAIVNLFVSTGLAFAFSGFINVWAGKNYLLPEVVMIVIVLNYSINQARYVVQNFIAGMGLYWSLRWKSLIEAGINLGLSLLFVSVGQMGVLGVVIGTLGSNILINVFWEPYIVFHDGLKLPLKRYFCKYFMYEAFTLIVIVIVGKLGLAAVSAGLPMLILDTMALELTVLLLFGICTSKSDEFKYVKILIQKLLVKVKNTII